LTIRTLTKNPPKDPKKVAKWAASWIIPATTGKHIVASLQPYVGEMEDLIIDAYLEDLDRHLATRRGGENAGLEFLSLSD